MSIQCSHVLPSPPATEGCAYNDRPSFAPRYRGRPQREFAPTTSFQSFVLRAKSPATRSCAYNAIPSSAILRKLRLRACPESPNGRELPIRTIYHLPFTIYHLPFTIYRPPPSIHDSRF